MRKEAKERLEGCAALACALLPAFFYLRTENSLVAPAETQGASTVFASSPCSPRSRLREECSRCAPALWSPCFAGRPRRSWRPPCSPAGQRRSPAWTRPPPTRFHLCRP